MTTRRISTLPKLCKNVCFNVQRFNHSKALEAENVMDCRQIAYTINKIVVSKIAEKKFLDQIPPPTLSIIYDGDHRNSTRRANQIESHCKLVGIEAFPLKMSKSATSEQLHDTLVQIKLDPKMDACMVNMPNMARSDLSKALAGMSLQKDIDAVSVEYQNPENFEKCPYMPVKASAALEILRNQSVNVERKTVLLHGTTHNLAFLKYIFNSAEGKKNVQVFHTNAETSGHMLKDVALKADIIMTEVGLPNSVTPDMIKAGCHVIDLSQNHMVGKDGEIYVVGDVDFEQVRSVAAGVTPVWGGINYLGNAIIGAHTLVASLQRQTT